MMGMLKDLCGKERALKFGQMEPDMRVIGKKTVLGDMVNLLTKTGITTKEIGYTMKQMGQEFTRERMGQSMKEDGEETYSMAKGNRLGRMEVTMKVSLNRESSKASENTVG